MNPLCVSGYGKIRRTEDAFPTERRAHAFQDFSHRTTRISGSLSAIQRRFPHVRKNLVLQEAVELPFDGFFIFWGLRYFLNRTFS